MLAGYVLVAFAYWGVRLLPHPGRVLLGSGSDPQIFLWSLGWWPHAFVHGLNPIHTTSSTTATAIAMPRTRRIVRVRTSTTRSGVT